MRLYWSQFRALISVTGAFLPFCMGIHGRVVRICQVWEQSPLGATIAANRGSSWMSGALDLHLVMQ